MSDTWVQKQIEKQNTILNDKELAKNLDPTGKIVTTWTIRGWRIKGGMPHFRAGGNRIFFRSESVLEWLDKQEKGETVEPTPEYGTLRRID